MATCKLVSADSHVNEPAELWVERIDRKFRERAPRIVDNIPARPPGSYLVLEDIPPVHVSQGLGAGKTAEELPQFFQTSTYRDARRGGWDPAARLEDMELDGVDAEVLYTTLGFRQFWLKDAELQRACFRVYNRWLAEYCAYAPRRLTGLALISLYDIGEAVKELGLCRQQGLKGAMIWASPPEERSYADTVYDPFWAEAQELAIPLSLHAVTGMGRESQALRVMGREVKAVDRYIQSVTLGDEVKRSLTVLVFSGVLERFPRLKIVSDFPPLPALVPFAPEDEAERILQPADLCNLYRRCVRRAQSSPGRNRSPDVVVRLPAYTVYLASFAADHRA